MYNALILMGDIESGSYWDHITGRCVHGPLEGYTLAVFPLVNMTASQALSSYPDLQVALSALRLAPRILSFFMEWSRRSRRGFFPPVFMKTMGPEDTRRPRMEQGLGVWTAADRRFYPLKHLRQHGGAVIDELGGRRLLVCIDRQSGLPAAVYTRAAACSWQQATLCLDSGELFRGGTLRDDRGVLQRTERPLQLFTRWYGFACTFPGCTVYQHRQDTTTSS